MSLKAETLYTLGRAMRTGEVLRIGNVMTVGRYYHLFGNPIAYVTDTHFNIILPVYESVTTTTHLNGLLAYLNLRVRLYRKNGYLMARNLDTKETLNLDKLYNEVFAIELQ